MAPQLPPKLVEGRYTMKSLVDTAERVVTKKTTGSRILDLDAENQIPKFGFSGACVRAI